MSGKERLNVPREYLGDYKGREPLPPLGLTQHDIGELIKRAGLAGGFVVEAEFEVALGKSEKGYIDWVWFDKDDRRRPVVAIEVEGHDVREGYLKHDRRKFDACGADLNVVVIFQVDMDLVVKRNASTKSDQLARIREYPCVQGANLLLFKDSELMASGGIEGLVYAANDAAAPRRMGK